MKQKVKSKPAVLEEEDLQMIKEVKPYLSRSKRNYLKNHIVT